MSFLDRRRLCLICLDLLCDFGLILGFYLQVRDILASKLLTATLVSILLFDLGRAVLTILALIFVLVLRAGCDFLRGVTLFIEDGIQELWISEIR